MSNDIVYFVYALTFSNGKVYIGMSKTDKKGLYTVRYRKHAYDAKKGKQLPIYNAWRKYGAPKQEIISLHSTREECAESEIEAIKIFDSTNPENGYNIALGGQGMHAPKGSIMYDLMMEKVWRNPERLAKASAFMKGKPLSKEALEASNKWKKSEEGRAKFKESWQNEQRKANASNLTKQQMTLEARAHLSKIHTGRKDPRSEEGKRISKEKRIQYLATDSGKESCRKGYKAFASNPQNIANNRASLDKWRASDRNKEQCKEMAKKAAEVCSKRVKLVDSDIIYNSQREMAKSLGIHEATICNWVKTGKAIRL